MTKTTLTKNEIASNYPAVTDLGDLIKKLEEKFQVQGEVICQFKLNGMRLTEDDEKRLSQIEIGEIENLEIDSQSPQELLFNLLDNWTQELPVLMQNADQLAKEIKFKGIEGQMKSFVDLLDTCQFLTESLISLEAIIKTTTSSQSRWREAEELTARAIGQALKSFETKDFVLLSEILEYDLGHALQVWFEEIKRLSQNLKEDNASDPTGFSERVFIKGE